MILVKDTDAKSVNAAILALNDDLDKQVKAVKNNNAGIVEGETYNINISGNSRSVKNALTITSTTGDTTVYDGSEAKTATIYTPDQAVNKTSSPTFASIIAASLIGNASTATKLIGSPAKSFGFTYSEYTYSNIPSLNMNYYRSPGIYGFVEDMVDDTSKSLVNAPYSKVDGGWSLMVLPTGTRYCCQLFFAYNVAKIYVRSSFYVGGPIGFGPWYEK